MLMVHGITVMTKNMTEYHDRMAKKTGKNTPLLHICRDICRRYMRRLVQSMDREQSMNPLAHNSTVSIKYLQRSWYLTVEVILPLFCEEGVCLLSFDYMKFLYIVKKTQQEDVHHFPVNNVRIRRLVREPRDQTCSRSLV